MSARTEPIQVKWSAHALTSLMLEKGTIPSGWPEAPPGTDHELI